MALGITAEIGLGILGVFVLAALAFIFGTPNQTKKKVALVPTEYKKFKLIQKRNISHNTLFLRFQLDTADTILGLPVGKHLFLRFTDADGKIVSRPYTPVSSDHESGYFDLVIKTYPTGKMSQHLVKLNVNEHIECRGPAGSLTYHGNGKFNIMRKIGGESKSVDYQVKNVGMICGGSGITPCLQVAREILRHASDRTHVSLIFANVSEEDILLRDELDKCAAEHSNFKIHYTLDRPSESWRGGKGFVTADMIQQQLCAPANDHLVLLCGPKPMMDFMHKNLASLDYKEDAIFTF